MYYYLTQLKSVITLSGCTSEWGRRPRACLDVLGAHDDEGDLAVVQAVVAHAAHEPLLRAASLASYTARQAVKRKKNIFVA